MASMLPSADRDLAGRVMDASRSDRERWQDFVRLWPFVRFTGYGNVIARMLDRWGLSAELTSETYDEIRKQLQQRSPDLSREAYVRAGIEATTTHFLAHPSCGGLANLAEFLSGDLSFDRGFHPLLGTLPLHEFVDRDGVELLSRVCDEEIHNLAGLTNAIDALIARTNQLGVVGMKDHAAYSRGLSFGEPGRVEAERELGQLLRGEDFPEGARRLSDYVFHHIVQQSIEHGIPMVIHTGYLVGCAHPKANVRDFAPILAAYPEARFDLYHLNYPWTDDLIAILKRFPNTWANCCWTHIIDPAATVDFLRRALGTIPTNHIFGFGGDFVALYEPVVAHLEIARDNIAVALNDMVGQNLCSQQDALEIARLWLYENPRRFYGI